MDAERWPLISRLYHGALERPGDKRRAFLDAACRGDDVLRGEIESLLAREASAEVFLALPAAEASAESVLQDPDVSSGALEPRRSYPERLGRYRLDRELGRGGMGVVYAAYDKPSNIFLTPHGAKILDFGLAQSARSDLLQSQSTQSPLTKAGVIVGTPPYMAPEQFRGEPVDARTDLFAMGAVIFEMLTGTRAFPGDTPMEVYHGTMYEQPPALGGSPAAAVVDRVVRRALAKTAGDRFSGADQMAESLRAACEVEDTGETRAHRIGRLLVLPFRILKPDPEVDFLALSVPDAITNALTGLESLVVRSTAGAVRFASDRLDLVRIAEEADVDVVLTGSLLRAAQQIRVTVQLVKVPDGTVLWSHAPQVTLRDVFQLQDQIVTHIVESLSLSLTAPRASTAKKPICRPAPRHMSSSCAATS